ncbi:uncharacterized protein LOC123861542 [Mirounga angustirostris]|uniref:uncharacterized protein LOC123861542 n=1 Tax=Mirounga angustirostris TaxID=9716 RepID=UPI00313EDB3A
MNTSKKNRACAGEVYRQPYFLYCQLWKTYQLLVHRIVKCYLKEPIQSTTLHLVLMYLQSALFSWRFYGVCTAHCCGFQSSTSILLIDITWHSQQDPKCLTFIPGTALELIKVPTKSPLCSVISSVASEHGDEVKDP